MTAVTDKIAISGIGCVGAFGCGTQDYVAALKRGYVDVLPQEKNHPDGTSFLPALLADTAHLTDYVPRRALRRIDHYARMALLGGYLALADVGLSSDQCEKLGVIVASGYGALTTTFNFLDSVLDDGDSCTSPTSFSNSVHNVAAAYLSMQLQAFGPSLTVSQFELSVCSALHTAVCWLEQGRVDKVLIGGVDEYNPVVNDYCRQRFSDHDVSIGNIDPFNFNSCSTIAGEGAAFLLLTKGDKWCGGESEQACHAPYAYVGALSSGNFSRLDCKDYSPQVGQRGSDLMIIGADGQCDSGNLYSQLQFDRPTLSCSPCYGALPVGQAFDLVAAALMLREQSMFAVNRYQTGTNGNNVNFVPKIDTITSLKIAPTGQFGQIELCAGVDRDA